METLRAPDARFANLPDYPFEPQVGLKGGSYFLEEDIPEATSEALAGWLQAMAPGLSGEPC